MRAHDVRGYQRQRRVRTTIPEPSAQKVPDLPVRAITSPQARATTLGIERPLTSGRKRTPTLHRPCCVAARSFAARSSRGGSASSLLHRHTGTIDALEHTIRRPGGHPQRAKVTHRPKQVLRAHGSCWPISPVPVRTTTTEEVREAEPAAVAAWLARINLTGEDQ
jgi:hypothetical protein